MIETAKIPGDRLVLAMISVFRTLVLDLSNRGAINLPEFVTMIEQTAAAHREYGDPNRLADAIHSIAEHLAAAPEPRRR